MLSKELKQTLKKQHYAIVGKHSAVHPCSWCKKSLIDEGECYKQKFYGIKSHLCCQMSPTTNCQNKCLHCWRAIELSDNKIMNLDEIDNPKEIVEQSIKAQQKLLTGFKGNKKINMEKFKQAQDPQHFAISLIGEPTLYPKLGELINELRKKQKTTFIVTNGLQPEVLKKLNKNNQLPTQLYISLNSPNQELFNKWHNSTTKDAWQKFNKSLELFSKLKDKTRTVIRMTLVKGINNNMKQEHIQDYINLIKKASPDFIEIKGFMSVGYARQRKGMGYDNMPTHQEIKDFAKQITKELNQKILDEQEFSRVVLIGKDRKKMKIKKSEI